VIAAQFDARCHEKNQGEERLRKRQEFSHPKLVEITGQPKMNFHAAVETYTRRASQHADCIRTYREPALPLSMLGSLRAETGIEATDLGCGQGDALKRWRTVGADIAYIRGDPHMLLRGIERGNIPGGSAILCRLGNCHLPFLTVYMMWLGFEAGMRCASFSSHRHGCGSDKGGNVS
jgi:hypothetical protein